LAVEVAEMAVKMEAERTGVEGPVDLVHGNKFW